MYLGSWRIGDNLTFTCNTHTANTGAGTDADAVPSYRVYENETATPLLTGNMALLDVANTIGFYSEQIALTTANGFEAGKAYTIYITATVATIAGTMSYCFQVEPVGNAGALTLTYTLTSSVDGTPIADATVELYTEIGMSNLIDSQTTNAFGVATFSNLVAGTYYLKRIKSGWTFTNPDSEAVA